jgi:hypothetical protein
MGFLSGFSFKSAVAVLLLVVFFMALVGAVFYIVGAVAGGRTAIDEEQWGFTMFMNAVSVFGLAIVLGGVGVVLNTLMRKT